MKPCGCPALPSGLQWLGTLTLLLGGLAQPLAAQLKSVPVYPLLAVRQGWAAGLDFGSGLNDASGHARHLGARVGGGAGRRALAGAGYTRAGPAAAATTYVTVPLGIALVRSGLQTSRGAVTPWLMSRVETMRVSFGTVRASQNGVGVSGGMAAARTD